MNRYGLVIGAAAIAAIVGGISASLLSGSSAGGIAVVDLDEVARQLGRDAEMVNSIQTQAGQLSQKLTAVQQDANQKLQQIRASLGEQPTEDQAKQFLQIQRNAALQLNQLRQRAESSLGQHRLQLVGQFREQTKPIATKVAKEKGLTTVFTRNDAVVFSFDDAVDITDEVVAEMKAAGLASSPSQKAPTATPAPTTPASSQQPATAAAPQPEAAGPVRQVSAEVPADESTK